MEMKKKLLAIVDDWERLERYEDRLHSLFDFRSSPFGSHGIQLAIEEKPDVILIDLEFEDMTEKEALGLIRAEDSLQKVPVVLVQNTENGPHPPHTHAIQRPVSIEKLLAYLKSNF
jgi:CheY-like chemotaxis protein